MTRTIQSHFQLFKCAPVMGEKITIGRREFQVIKIDDVNYELVETFFL